VHTGTLPLNEPTLSKETPKSRAHDAIALSRRQYVT